MSCKSANVGGQRVSRGHQKERIHIATQREKKVSETDEVDGRVDRHERDTRTHTLTPPREEERARPL